MMNTVVNAFTVDVEDYYHVSAFARQVQYRDWEHYESRVVGNTHRILELLEFYQVRATFFVLGWVAERRPQLVREIQRSGHEIGSHSYRHELIYKMTPDEFREDLVLSCKIIEDITGDRIIAYRAPSFSITSDSLWALDVLIDEGIELDSSIFPVRHDLYGIPDANARPHRIERSNGSLWECPGTVCQILGWNIPVGGGGYFRILPSWWTFSRLDALNRRFQQPFVFYIHPWEVDPQQPRVRGTWKSMFRHYTNLEKTERRLRRLLKTFSFSALSGLMPNDLEVSGSHAALDTGFSIMQVHSADA